MSTATTLLTAADYADLPDLGRPTELVRGEVIEMTSPDFRHGQVCLAIGSELQQFLKRNRLGRAVSNDTGIITERDPDTVRGPDVWYISYDTVPPGPLPPGYLHAVPDIVFEVVSPSDRWSEVLQKVSEYLRAGIPVVCVVDPKTETIHIYFDDEPEQTLTTADTLTFPNQLPGFSVPVQELFE